MKMFNQTLLTKQVWHLFQNSDSLAFGVLKSRYFLGGNILKNKLGYAPSCVWRSLFWGKELLEKGLVWRICDGRSVNPWRENWIPREARFKPIRCCQTPVPRSVDFFISDRQWDINKLNEFFIPGDVDAIKNIPLSSARRDDSLFWFYEEKDEYFVWSGYRLAMTLGVDDLAGSSSVSTIWKKEYMGLERTKQD